MNVNSTFITKGTLKLYGFVTLQNAKYFLLMDYIYIHITSKNTDKKLCLLGTTIIQVSFVRKSLKETEKYCNDTELNLESKFFS